MVMAVDESLVKLELSEAGEPTAFEKTRALKPYGPVSIGWVSEDWKTKDGSPIGIGEIRLVQAPRRGELY